MAVSRAVEDGLTVITGAPEKTPTIMPAVLGTEGTTVGPAPEGADTTVAMNKEEDETISDSPVTASTAAATEFVTEPHAVVTGAPAAATEEARAEVTTAAEAKTKDALVIEEGTDEASGEKRHSGTNGVGRSVSLLLA